MLRTALFLGPIVLVSAISCSDSGDTDLTQPGSNNQGGESETAAGGADVNLGGSPSTSGKSGGGSSAAAGSRSSSEGGASDTPVAGAPSESVGGGSDGATGGEGSGIGGAAMSAAGAGGAATCPDVFGAYSIKNREGTCGDIDKNAPQSIEATSEACFARFVSTPDTGKAGINGGAQLAEDGGFMGVKLRLGSTDHTPCSGSYNVQSQMMTIKCGSPGALCTLLLEKN